MQPFFKVLLRHVLLLCWRVLQTKRVNPDFFSAIASALSWNATTLDERQLGSLIRSASLLGQQRCNSRLLHCIRAFIGRFKGDPVLLPHPVVLAVKVFAQRDSAFASQCLLDIALEDLPSFYMPLSSAVQGTPVAHVLFGQLAKIAMKDMQVHVLYGYWHCEQHDLCLQNQSLSFFWIQIRLSLSPFGLYEFSLTATG